jgi:hypothetical protein
MSEDGGISKQESKGLSAILIACEIENLNPANQQFKLKHRNSDKKTLISNGKVVASSSRSFFRSFETTTGSS